MNANVTAEQATVLDWLLSQLASSAHGAIDFWTLVCLGQLPNRREFLVQQCEKTRSLVLVLDVMLNQLAALEDDNLRVLVKEMLQDCEKLQRAFLSLSEFRSLPLDHLKGECETLAQVYHGVCDSTQRLSLLLDVPVAFWRDLSPEQETYYQAILRGLFSFFCQEIAKSLSGTSAQPA